MSKQYRLQRDVFTKLTVEEEANQYANHWRARSAKERVQAANYLILSAYGLLDTEFPKMDKHAFQVKSRS